MVPCMPVLEAVPLREPLISLIGDRLIREAGTPVDFSKTAVVFPGKRPGLYLTRYLSERLHSAFFPPRIFTVTEFMAAAADNHTGEIGLLDAVYELFTLVRGSNAIVNGQTFDRFEDFVFWGIELFKAIDELDSELVESSALASLSLPNAPPGITRLLHHFAALREQFHSRLEQTHLTTRGMIYTAAAQRSTGMLPLDYDHIYFTGLIALTKAEAAVIRAVLNRGNNAFFTQVDPSDDSAGLLEQSLGAQFRVHEPQDSGRQHADTGTQKLVLYEADDMHGEVEYVYSVLRDDGRGAAGTAIVLPDAATLLPLLANVMDYLPYDYNVTMGYPLKRTPFYTLINAMFDAQTSARPKAGGAGRQYYAKDYLRVLKHPYIKGMHDQRVHTVIQHIEAYIVRSGTVFIGLGDIENGELYRLISEDEGVSGESPGSPDMVESYIRELHALFFKPFEPDRLVVRDFARALETAMQALLRESSALRYKFSPSFIRGLLDSIAELRDAAFRNEHFDRQRLFALFNSSADMQSIPFNGIPLTELQILGLLETRVLNFERVVLLDCNEGVLPSVPRYEPLLPFQVKKALHLPTYREYEHVFRYHFRRLIGSAEEVHLIYRKGEDVERSRFLEELIWEKEKQMNTLIELKTGSRPAGTIGFVKKQFNTGVRDPAKTSLKKTGGVMDILIGKASEGLSPTAINMYLDCPARFYYRYILKLQEAEATGEELEAKDIGSFIHKVLELFYQEYVQSAYVYSPPQDEVLERIIETTFATAFHGEDNGEFFLLREIVKRLLKGFIRKDGADRPVIISLENSLSTTLSAIRGTEVRIKGQIDRIDRKGDQYRIVDYKTGSTAELPRMSRLAARLADGPLETRAEMKAMIQSFQLPMYLSLCRSNADKLNIGRVDWEHLNASLFMIKNKGSFDLPLFKEKHDGHHAEFMERMFLPSLKNLIQEILDPAVAFERDDSDPAACAYCPYLALCR